MSQCRQLYFSYIYSCSIGPASPSQHEKVMNMDGVMRIPEFDKFYRVKANEFFEPYL